MANRYVVAAGGNWNSPSTWAATSGGAGGETVPTATDAVFCDAASGNLTLVGTCTCLTFDATGYTGTITGSANLTVTGNLFRLSATTVWSTTSGTLNITGANASADIVIDAKDIDMIYGVTINATSHPVVQASALRCGANFRISAGTFSSEGFALSIYRGTISATDSSAVSIDLSDSVVTLGGNLTITGSGVTSFISPAVLNLSTSHLLNNIKINFAGSSVSTPVVFPSIIVDCTSILDVNGNSILPFGIRFGADLEITSLVFTDDDDANSIVIAFEDDIQIDVCDFPEYAVLCSSIRGSQIEMTGTTLTFTRSIIGDIAVVADSAIAIDCFDRGNNDGITFTSLGELTHEVSGITRTKSAILGECDVFLMKRVDDELIQVSYTESGIDGTYTLGAPDSDPNYVLVSIKGSPERADAMSGIVPTEI